MRLRGQPAISQPPSPGESRPTCASLLFVWRITKDISGVIGDLPFYLYPGDHVLVNRCVTSITSWAGQPGLHNGLGKSIISCFSYLAWLRACARHQRSRGKRCLVGLPRLAGALGRWGKLRFQVAEWFDPTSMMVRLHDGTTFEHDSQPLGMLS